MTRAALAGTDGAQLHSKLCSEQGVGSAQGSGGALRRRGVIALGVAVEQAVGALPPADSGGAGGGWAESLGFGGGAGIRHVWLGGRAAATPTNADDSGADGEEEAGRGSGRWHCEWCGERGTLRRRQQVPHRACSHGEQRLGGRCQRARYRWHLWRARAGRWYGGGGGALWWREFVAGQGSRSSGRAWRQVAHGELANTRVFPARIGRRCYLCRSDAAAGRLGASSVRGEKSPDSPNGDSDLRRVGEAQLWRSRDLAGEKWGRGDKI
jgi:hypothetical protein